MGSCDRSYEHLGRIKNRGLSSWATIDFPEITVVSRISQFTFIELLILMSVISVHISSHVNEITNFIQRVYFNSKGYYNGWDNPWTGICQELGYAQAEIWRGQEYVMNGTRVSISMEASTLSFRVSLLQNYYSCWTNWTAEMTINNKNRDMCQIGRRLEPASGLQLCGCTNHFFSSHVFTPI